MAFRRVGAFGVHVLTACGAALALLALMLATEQRWAAMFACLGVALLIDGVDGPLARRLRVGEALPRWSGDAIDLVVDFVTYVFVPAYAIASGGLVSRTLGIASGIAICITGALYFADRQMKTADNYFRGFPAVWNVAAFYLYVLKPPPAIAAASVFVLAAFSFVPLRFLHPLRVVRLRALTVVLLGVWALLAVAALSANLSPGLSVTVPLSVIAAYFLAAGLVAPAKRASMKMHDAGEKGR